MSRRRELAAIINEERRALGFAIDLLVDETKRRSGANLQTVRDYIVVLARLDKRMAEHWTQGGKRKPKAEAYSTAQNPLGGAETNPAAAYVHAMIKNGRTSRN